MSITREQADEILSRAQECASKLSTPANWYALRALVDSLVAEPAEQPMFANAETMVAVTRAQESQQNADDARLHADDARAAMQVRLTWWLNDDANSDLGTRADLMREACLDADAMQAERNKRRVG